MLTTIECNAIINPTKPIGIIWIIRIQRLNWEVIRIGKEEI